MHDHAEDLYMYQAVDCEEGVYAGAGCRKARGNREGGSRSKPRTGVNPSGVYTCTGM